MPRTKLSINLNKVALLRNQRDLTIPSVTGSARTCIAAGCDGITVHPRPDERHIRRQDVTDLAEIVSGVEYNIEGNPFPDFMELVKTIRPTQCTLVPDSPEQSTSDHGWDLQANCERLRPLIAELQEVGVRVSLFLDPVVEEVERASQTGADRIELYTEPYASAYERGAPGEELERYRLAAEAAHEMGLGINAGHDLSLNNLGLFCRQVPRIAEVSIGHAFISDALDTGLAAAVRAYQAVLSVETWNETG